MQQKTESITTQKNNPIDYKGIYGITSENTAIKRCRMLIKPAQTPPNAPEYTPNDAELS